MKNKVAIVTGGSGGIGSEISRMLAAEGCKVVINYFNNKELAENLKLELDNKNFTCEVFKADIRSEKDVDALIDFTFKTYGSIDFIINNAAIVYDKEWNTKEMVEWENTFRTNVFSIFYIIKKAEKFLKESKQGRIVNISSTNATNSYSSFSMDYDASKAAVISMTKNFSKIFAPNVTVNTVLPGWVNTKMNDSLDKDFIKNECEKISLKRFAEPKEIASVVKFLCSEDASYINGAEIVVDGGVI